jgi:hypothetical protein
MNQTQQRLILFLYIYFEKKYKKVLIKKINTFLNFFKFFFVFKLISIFSFILFI